MYRIVSLCIIPALVYLYQCIKATHEINTGHKSFNVYFSRYQLLYHQKLHKFILLYNEVNQLQQLWTENIINACIHCQQPVCQLILGLMLLLMYVINHVQLAFRSRDNVCIMVKHGQSYWNYTYFIHQTIKQGHVFTCLYCEIKSSVLSDVSAL